MGVTRLVLAVRFIWPPLAGQTKVLYIGSCRIYRVTSPRGINPGYDMSAWSHTGWVGDEERGGLQRGQDAHEQESM